MRPQDTEGMGPVGTNGRKAMKPTRTEFYIGETVHGQSVRLIHERQVGAAAYTWTLVQDAANQRDDTNRIGGLTDDALLSIADAVKSVKTP